MLPEDRRAATVERIVARQLPYPQWVSVHPGSRFNGPCDGCGEAITTVDHAFTVVLKGEIILQFHDEGFDVYNRCSPGPR